jgi:integrase
MKGCRDITDEEIAKIKEYFSSHIADSKLARRDYTLLMMGLSFGFRIAELLSLRLKDVYEPSYQRVRDFVYLRKENTKKQLAGRTIPLSDNIKSIIKEYVDHYALSDPSLHLFFSSHDHTRPIRTRQAYNIIIALLAKCDIHDRIGTHSMRKTFARKVHNAFKGDIMSTAKAMGHMRIDSTVSYLQSNDEKIEGVIRDLSI